MQGSNHDAITKLIQLYDSGKSLNAADGKCLQVRATLPGSVIEVSSITKTDAQSQIAHSAAEKERLLQLRNEQLEKQRTAFSNEKDSPEKIDYSVFKSDVSVKEAQKSTLSIAAALSRCSKVILRLDNRTDAAEKVPSIENEDHEDFQQSIRKLASIRRITTASVQRERPIKTKAQPKRDIFVREVAGHLRSTTKAKTWCEWENDENFEIYCQQVHEYETIQSSLRWLECETRSWNYAKMLMEEGKSSSGALSFSQARAMMVEYFNIRLGNDVLVALCRVSQTGTISRVQEIIATYKRLAGPSAFKKNVQANTSNLLKEVKLPDLSQTMEDTKIKEVSKEESQQLQDEKLALLLQQRNINQAWKQRFAEMMDSLDAKASAKRAIGKQKFIQQYVRKAKAIYDLGSNKFIDVLYAHSPELVGHGCEENLKRFWNFLLVSGTVLNQLINNCEFFVLTYYSKKIQKQWRTVRTRRYFAAILSRSKYLSSLTQKAKFWKEETGFKLSTFGRVQMLNFRTSMKTHQASGLLEWDREFAQSSTITDNLAAVSTLHNRMGQLKSTKNDQEFSSENASLSSFSERHIQAAKWNLHSQYFELVTMSVLRIQSFWRSVCKRRSFFVCVRYAAAFCILRWMLSKIKGRVHRASGGMHALQVTASYTTEAAHLAHLIFEKNSLRYQMEGTTLLQNRRKYLANDLTILRTIQEYQSRDRLRLAREAIGLTDKMRVAALKETTEADDNMNKVIQAEQVRRIPRPTIPSDSVSQPLGPEMDGRHVFLLEGKLAARQHKEYQRKLFQWNNLQAASENQAGLHMEQKLAATALLMQLKSKSILMKEAQDRNCEDGAQ